MNETCTSDDKRRDIPVDCRCSLWPLNRLFPTWSGCSYDVLFGCTSLDYSQCTCFCNERGTCTEAYPSWCVSTVSCSYNGTTSDTIEGGSDTLFLVYKSLELGEIPLI